MVHTIKPSEEESDYDENADEDFNPESANAADEDASSSSEDEEAPAAAKKVVKGSKKRKTDDVEDWDSGDEATIKERRRKKRKGAEDADSGGEGGLIKTRAQRQAEKAEKKAHRRAHGEGVTVNVNELWAQLSSAPVGRPPPAPAKEAEEGELDKENVPDTKDDGDEEYITIKRSYRFAGEAVTEDKRVPKNSAEAKHYLESHPNAATQDSDLPSAPDNAALRRPLKRPSMFEPNPTGLVKGLAPERQRLRAPSRADVLVKEQRAEEERAKKAQKMTTVQKSAVDWAGYVDKEGIQEELDEYGKAKDNFLSRTSFLGNVEAQRMQAGRSARLQG